MEGMVKFDESKILTVVTADRAKVGDVGWFGDSVDELRLAITSEMEKPSELKLIDSDSCQYRFSDGPEDYSLFYPAPYVFLQEQWVEENKLGVGDKVAIISNWESGDKGYKYNQSRPVGSVLYVAKIDCEAITAILDTTLDAAPVDLPYFAIEKIKEEPEPESNYRPFANAEEFAPHRNKWLVGDSGRTWYRVLRFNKYGVTLEGDLIVPYADLDSFGYVFEDGSPTGVKM